MQSRKDQVQAYFFVVGRLVAAVTHGSPDRLESPNRRLNTGVVMGFLLAALLVAVFGIYGLFVPGGDTSWRQAGTIVMDKSTGARYVYLDGQLRPVLNYASARLVAANSGGAVVSVSRNSLAGTPVGQPIGIAGAPDSVPTAGNLTSGAWTVCVQQPLTPSGTPVVTVLLAQRESAPLGTGQALLVSTPDGATWLLWQGRRHRVPERWALDALGYGGVPATPVTTSWLNPIPAGPDLAVPQLGRVGQPGPVVDGRPSVIGQVYEVRNPAIDADQLYLVRGDGFVPLSRTAAALVLAAPVTRQAYHDGPVAPIQVGPGALTGVPATGTIGDGLPPVPPELLTPPNGTVPCLRYDPKANATTVELLAQSQVDSDAMPVARHVAGTMADRVVIPGGTGVLARELPAPGATPGAAYLLTDTGVRFPVADANAMAALGYSDSDVVRLPAELLALLPTGPVLSMQAALQNQGPAS
ncbi:MULTISPECIES: type VII secretion protein EccB [Amycolatopsis]|uniref:Type VII secretion protein EccB n=2 Tax=Amycolatopsis TaxID=1813 RepID=A0A1I3WXZ1_9PSEU|nr:type VII secretion protein EccB [Amycolatopsis sacchari]SFK12009.1 type VII secretion protein EccB [Amycolatopsis sacchari]